MAYDLGALIHDLEMQLPHASDPTAAVQCVAHALKPLLSNRHLFDRDFAQALLAGDTDGRIYTSPQGFFVQVFAWPVGCATPVHDHLTWGVMGIYHQQLQIIEYQKVPGEQPGTFDLQESDRYLAQPGMISAVIPPSDEIHHVSNPGPHPAFSIHVYGQELERYHVFDLEQGEVRIAGTGS
jgi:predicted metal-dependent enzyme (double-stranded beta helix superfamily)